MKKSINLYFSDYLGTKEKLDLIKKCGYDGVFVKTACESETMTLADQINYAKKIGLEVNMIHTAFKGMGFNDFWLDENRGKELEMFMHNQIDICKDFGVKDLVFHLCSKPNPKNSKIGIERIKSLISHCEKQAVNLCIENIYSVNQIKFIFENVKNKNLTFCYDCGHHNCFCKSEYTNDQLAKKLTQTHLHDNDAQSDEHKILGEGNLNYLNLTNFLKKSNLEFLSSEIKTDDKNLEKVLVDNFKSLSALEAQIEI